MSAALSTEGLAKRFGSRHALEGLSIRVDPGECLGLVGPNGAGKSTTIHLLSGVIEADQGSFRFAPAKESRGPKLGVVFGANLAPEPAWSPRRVLRHFGALAGLSRHEIDARANELLRVLELGDEASHPCAQLSGGNLRKVEISRALLPRPNILILDEPTRELDITAKAACWRLIELAKASGTAVLLATHDPTEIARLCDRIGVLRRGRLVWEGPTRDLSLDPTALMDDLHRLALYGNREGREDAPRP